MDRVESMRAAGAEPEQLAEAALSDPMVLDGLLRGLALTNTDSSLRHACERALLAVAAKHPEMLAGHWDYFVELLLSDNAYAKVNGAYMVTALAGTVAPDKVEAVLADYFALLDDRSIMVAGHVASLASQIARGKPALADAVAERLLGIDATHHSPERKELLATYAMPALGECFHLLSDRHRVLDFVRGRLTSESPRARKAAAAFLKRHDKAKTAGNRP